MAGNHDYLRTKSCYLSAEWQENVYFFRQEEVGHFDFDEENVSIYGLSYWHRELPEDIYDGIIPEKKEQINILLAHGGDADIFRFRQRRYYRTDLIILLQGISTRENSSWMTGQ